MPSRYALARFCMLFPCFRLSTPQIRRCSPPQGGPGPADASDMRSADGVMTELRRGGNNGSGLLERVEEKRYRNPGACKCSSSEAATDAPTLGTLPTLPTREVPSLPYLR
ncbi:hypothetical protein L209DRAFT_749495 [Thermothelomyces heterothallicus CBS 203.75]